jgi:hypothetical protein
MGSQQKGRAEYHRRGFSYRRRHHGIYLRNYSGGAQRADPDLLRLRKRVEKAGFPRSTIFFFEYRKPMARL